MSKNSFHGFLPRNVTAKQVLSVMVCHINLRSISATDTQNLVCRCQSFYAKAFYDNLPRDLEREAETSGLRSDAQIL